MNWSLALAERIVKFSLSRKVNIALVTLYSLRAVNWLSEAASHAEWIGACRSGTIKILSLQRLSVNCHWRCFGVITMRNTALQLFISALLGATPHATLNNQLVIPLSHWHINTVLGPHDLLANCVAAQIFGAVLSTVPGLEVPLLPQFLLSIVFFFHLLSNLCCDHLLKSLGL